VLVRTDYVNFINNVLLYHVFYLILGLNIYRNLDSVGKGANLTIHCLSRSLEKFRLRHQHYPEVVFLQVPHI
jgi:hypothetical protein